MSLSVTVLGSSGSYAAPGNPCTGYLLRSEGATVLLDCGPGTLGPLQAAIDLADLDAIVLTHSHPDHWMELPVMRNVFSYFTVECRFRLFPRVTTPSAQARSTSTLRHPPLKRKPLRPMMKATTSARRYRNPRRCLRSRWWNSLPC